MNNGKQKNVFGIIDNWAEKQVTKPSILTYDLEELKKQLNSEGKFFSSQP